MKKYDIAIIGGGILGTSISYWISTLHDLNVCVIEKEEDVGQHSSTRNSGVVHYPFYLNSKRKKNFSKAAFLSHKSCEVKKSNTRRKARNQYVICAIFFFKIKDITRQ